jgi:hypothetical protein
VKEFAAHFSSYGATNYEEWGRAGTLTNAANEVPRMRKNKGTETEPEGQSQFLRLDHVLTPARRDYLSTRAVESSLQIPWAHGRLPTAHQDEDYTMVVRATLLAAALVIHSGELKDCKF